MSILDYDWSLIWDNRDALLSGLWTAFSVAIVGLAISLVFGLLLAVLRSAPKPVNWLASAYINIFRGVPALVSVIWVYFGLALLLGVRFTVFQAGVIALSLLYSAFFAEIFRSALQAVPAGHTEAGWALGMRSSQIFFSVTLPQAIKIALPNIGSMFIGMVKDTSTFTVIGLLEVVRVTQNLVATTFQPFVLYTAAAIIYVLAAFAIDLVFRLIEGAYVRPPLGIVGRTLRARQRRTVDALAGRIKAVTPATGTLYTPK
ncbi:amino acid ABC transporter permease [Microbacterium sp. Marseille-Q6648]|jgi:His/Glu/Gln/Arg/opine family amino acid ABC transporter permease subunit|uniref:amino acid ABC transporter permease n=1 Tax=Microbacterium sp. Marseille-Q6648 TaxID=2937991 RepID=UPI00203D0720|nr:amino acid ABC transporter permease [Microbacterium sp. Marseille-Q6648]